MCGSTYTSRHADVSHCLKSLAGWTADTFKEASCCRFFKHTELPIEPFQQSANLWIGSGPSTVYEGNTSNTVSKARQIHLNISTKAYWKISAECSLPVAHNSKPSKSVNCAFQKYILEVEGSYTKNIISSLTRMCVVCHNQF